ncbi:hypothetical protein SDC9_88618 [bioreactor metagenome]|uniref:Uncharacterized protein n=1 Tax=bioreactor metagenome TaxID=1076179 RepID=A0A644ZMF0_9ZZZZ
METAAYGVRAETPAFGRRFRAEHSSLKNSGIKIVRHFYFTLSRFTVSSSGVTRTVSQVV